MKIFSLHIARLVTLIAALQILNMGFFVQDFEELTSPSFTISEHNVINSVVEYVSEVVLEKANAMPETNNKSNKDLQAHKHFVVKIIELRQHKLVPLNSTISNVKNCSFGQDYFYRFFKEINPPPPKV